MSDKFEFTYSAPTEQQRKEIERIKSQYETSPTSSKIQELRKLDNRVNSLPTIISMFVGLLGILVFGLGLAMALEFKLMIGGIIVGFIGCTIMSFAYFTYNKLFKFLRKKYGPKIISLSQELLNEDNK